MIVVDAERKVAVTTLRTVPRTTVAERGAASTVDIEVALPTAHDAARAASATGELESNGHDLPKPPRVKRHATERIDEAH